MAVWRRSSMTKPYLLHRGRLRPSCRECASPRKPFPLSLQVGEKHFKPWVRSSKWVSMWAAGCQSVYSWAAANLEHDQWQAARVSALLSPRSPPAFLDDHGQDVESPRWHHDDHLHCAIYAPFDSVK